MVYTGKDSFWFWGRETSGFGEGDNTADTHQPPNKITEAMKFPRPEYVEEALQTFDSLVPNVIFTSGRESNEKTINWIFADPFMGLCAFSEKSTDSDFSSSGYTTITASFSTRDHVDSIWIYGREVDYTNSANLDKLLKGGKILGRFIIMEANKLIREELSVKFADMEDMDGSEDTLTADSDFDDGTWGAWDKNGMYFPWNASIEWGGSEIQANYGIDIVKIRFGFEVPQKYWATFDSLAENKQLLEKIEPICEIEAILTDDSLIDELESLHSAKTTATLKLNIDATTNEEKYDQFTNAYVDSIDGLDEVPKAGEEHRLTILFKTDGGAYSLSYSYDDDNHADPGDRLNDT